MTVPAETSSWQKPAGIVTTVSSLSRAEVRGSKIKLVALPATCVSDSDPRPAHGVGHGADERHAGDLGCDVVERSTKAGEASVSCSKSPTI